ncbi:MAG: RluA family pseudouridine synthase [Planctomycetota bacterium]
MSFSDSNLVTLVVEHDLAGARVIDVLVRRWPDADRAWLRGRITAGDVTVNGGDVHPQVRVKVNDVVLVRMGEGAPRSHRASASATSAASLLPVLAENERCLIVDKPAGIPCVPDRFGRTSGVHGWLPELRPDADLRIVHRIDRMTSGCLLLAKGLEAARWCDELFREGRVAKEYLALVQGHVAEDEFVVDRALGPDPRRPGKVVVVAPDAKGARAASTRFFVIERFARHTLLRVVPLTGRGHQIRVHLSSRHHPIVGDGDYGARVPVLLSDLKPGYKSRPGQSERPLLDRFFLHAVSLRVPMPDSEPPLAATAPMPRELETLLAKLRRFAAE